MAANQERWSRAMHDLSELPENHQVLAIMNLSGERISVGIEDGDKTDKCVWIMNETMHEPHYLSDLDVDLFIAALRQARAEARGEN